MATAMKRLFDTVELFEAILLLLDMKSLLRIQWTCKSLLAFVTGSEIIQREIYFWQTTGRRSKPERKSTTGQRKWPSVCRETRREGGECGPQSSTMSTMSKGAGAGASSADVGECGRTG